MYRLVFGIGVALATVIQPPSADAKVKLLPQRAAYRLALLSSEQRSNIESVRGGLVLEWRASCDGWLSNQRLGFVTTTGEGPGFVYDVRFSSWEADDGTRLRFTMRTLRRWGACRGVPRRSLPRRTPVAAGRVDYNTPPDELLDLPAGTIFPTMHMEKVIEAALDGKHFIVHDVFDGAGEDGLNRVTSVIGRPVESGDGEQRWPVNLAYYGLETDRTLPDFQISFKLAPTGVLHDVVLDYGEFSLKGTMESLEQLPAPECQ